MTTTLEQTEQNARDAALLNCDHDWNDDAWPTPQCTKCGCTEVAFRYQNQGIKQGWDAARDHYKPKWTAIHNHDLEPEYGIYWTSFWCDGELHTGSTRIWLGDTKFASNVVAVIRVPEPAPYQPQEKP